jgi:hypothetical protein
MIPAAVSWMISIDLTEYGMYGKEKGQPGKRLPFFNE